MTIVETHSRYCPATDPRFTYRGEDVVQMLERVCGQIGYPKTIRVDNGSEFASRDLDLWAYANNVTLDLSRPGKLQSPAIRVSVSEQQFRRHIQDDSAEWRHPDELWKQLKSVIVQSGLIAPKP